MKAIQPRSFDLQERYEELSADRDPLVRPETVMDCKIFLPSLRKAFEHKPKSAVGRKPYQGLLIKDFGTSSFI